MKALDMDRIAAVFYKWGWRLPTGADGVTRGELRELERQGRVESHISKLPSGTEIRMWVWKGPRLRPEVGEGVVT